MSRSFVHLHCHSHYSLLDGAGPIEGLVDKAKKSGMNALAITDHGNLYGALEFYQKANAAGIKPIVGYEAYIAPGSRFIKEAPTGDQEASYHLTLLAKNRTGFKNLIKMASHAYLEGFYRKPRIDKELLKDHSEGIICLSGCVSGELSRTLLRGGAEPDWDNARRIAEWFQSIFGDRYFLEIQNNHLEIQRMALEGTVEVAKRTGIPLVATSDAHYVNREDAEAQDVLLCINTGRFRTDTNRMKMEGSEFFLRSPDEMYQAFPGLEDAVGRSQEIADSVDINLELGKRYFPTLPIPPERTPPDYLHELCVAGLKERYENEPGMLTPEGELAQVVVDRLDRELSCINKLGFANYFLVVWDFVRYSVENDIPCSARGSGVGSIVAFALKLSHVCPLKYDLLFERFLDENRKEAPDIDIDFCKDRRGDVIRYVKQKYGEANVAQIGTFGTLAARAAIRDVGRALGWPIPNVDAVVAMVPEELGISLDEALEKSTDLKKRYDADGEMRELYDFARKIEGLARNVGTHAAAVVIADSPLIEYVPLQHVQGKDEVITQWAMGDVEKAGLLKMDFLGLRNLTVLAKTIDAHRAIDRQAHRPLQISARRRRDLRSAARGETKGVFQLESGGIRDLLQRMKPDHFRDIIATNALYRPGPLEGGMVDEYIEVKLGRKAAEYLHPVMKEVLEETHGVMVYQEQVMRILNRLGDIPLPNSYTCIKAISKKKLEMIAKYRAEFVTGCKAKGLSEAQAVNLFEMIEKFAGYGFNKSHSTAYALIAYMTAYLKAHYPVEFMAALLCGDIEGRNFKKKDSLVEHLEDCRRMNITVMLPDVNTCSAEFAVADGKIYFGLSAIKGCGGSAATSLAEERDKNGPYKDLFDFCGRLDSSTVNRTAIESLIKAGAFDRLGGTRAQWTAVLDKALQAAASVLADKKRGQKGLFDEDDAEEAAAPGTAVKSMLPIVPPWDQRQEMSAEKEVLGFYLTSHPLAEYEKTFETYKLKGTVDAAALSHRTEVMLGGMIAAIKLSHSKNPRPGQVNTKYAMWDLEDMQGIMRCILWPEDFAKHGHNVAADKVVALRGVIDKRPGSEEANFIVNEIIPVESLESRFTKGVIFHVDETKHGEKGLQGLFEILRGYPGNCEVQLVLTLADQSRVTCTSEAVKVSFDPEMRRRVTDFLGENSWKPMATEFKPTPPKPQKRFERAGA
ncbi:MAG: DNA polymerase III subunit alpha [Pirellulales bacterium]